MKKSTLSILVAASEAAPLAKAGGLGDVVGSLPLAFRELDCRVAVVLPGYREALARNNDWKHAVKDLPVSLGKLKLKADVLETELAPGVPAYLVQRDEFFDRSGLYGGRRGEYFVNPERFIFFSRSVPALCSALDFQPDVIFANDWQAGLIMALLAEGALPGTAGVFAIHNMGYLGLVPPDRRDTIGLPDKYYTMEGLEYYGQMSLLKAGVVYAQAVTTVSPNYAREIQTPEFGSGMDGLMRSVSHRLHGILNGVDYQIWNPATDPHLEANYSPRDLTGKARCKQDLLKEMELPAKLLKRPLVGMVTRLVAQKGCSIVAEAVKDLIGLDLGLVLLGAGDEKYRDLFSELRARHPDNFGLKLDFDPVLAHKLVAGCDMLLVPSLYEPCGLTQMFSLKYGTVPVVRATGGLDDTVFDPNEGHRHGTGFKFALFRARDLVRAVRRAVKAFEDQKGWRAMMIEAMARDFSWQRSAEAYLEVFKRAVSSRRAVNR